MESSTSEKNVDFNLNNLTKFILISSHIFATILAYFILDFAVTFEQPVPFNGEVEDLTDQTILLFTIIKAFLIFPVLLITIYDIIFDNFFVYYKRYEENHLLYILGVFLTFALIYILGTAAIVVKTGKLLYLGVPPEIVIGTIFFSFYIIIFPSYFYIRYLNPEPQSKSNLD